MRTYRVVNPNFVWTAVSAVLLFCVFIYLGTGETPLGFGRGRLVHTKLFNADDYLRVSFTTDSS